MIAAGEAAIGEPGEGEEDTTAQDLIDAQQALADATEAQTEAIEALKKSVDEQNAIAKSEQAIGLAEARRAFADMLSGELGGIITNRSHTAGAGSVVRT